MTLSVLNPRTCGTCSLCCEVMSVESLKKPGNTRCDHQADAGGCTIYETRPQPCRNFECTWLADGRDHGFGFTDKESPARTGIVLVHKIDSRVGPVIVAHMARERSDQTYWGDRLLRKLERKHLVVVAWRDDVVGLRGPELRLAHARGMLN